MRPVEFDEANIKSPQLPNGTSRKVSFLGKDPGGTPISILCWEVSDEELEQLTKTRRVWTMLIGVQLNLMSLLTSNPFTDLGIELTPLDPEDFVGPEEEVLRPSPPKLILPK